MTVNLPVEELVELLGVRDALSFAERCGGAPVYVPVRLRGSELSKRAGSDVARKLASRYPATWLTIPRCARMVRRLRDDAVRADHAAGMSAPRLARKYRLTERHVWRILGESPADDRQTDLFS